MDKLGSFINFWTKCRGILISLIEVLSRASFCKGCSTWPWRSTNNLWPFHKRPRLNFNRWGLNDALSSNSLNPTSCSFNSRCLSFHNFSLSITPMLRWEFHSLPCPRHDSTATTQAYPECVKDNMSSPQSVSVSTWQNTRQYKSIMIVHWKASRSPIPDISHHNLVSPC